MKKLMFVILIILIGCAPWMKVGGPYKSRKHNYYVELPQGWMKLNTTKYLLITRDGVLLQNVVINNMDVDEPLKNTKKKLAKNMLPQEASEVIIDNIRSDSEVLNFVLIENVPMILCDHPGFKLLFTYKNRDGLEFKSIYCGFVSGNSLYAIRYTAPIRYYYHKDIETFEKILNSLEVTGTT